MKFFVSAISLDRQLGAMQFEADSTEEMKEKAKGMCPERGSFRAYEVEEFDEDLPVDEFVSAERMTELGY